MSLGERIKQLRESNGLSQRALAELLGVQTNTLWRWEKDQRTPSDEDKRRIAEILKTSVAYLMGETKDPSPAAATNFQTKKEPTSEEIGALVPLTLPSGRVIDVTPGQVEAYEAWDRKRNLDTTMAVAAALNIPLSDLVPAAQLDKCPTETHRNLVGLLKALAVADPKNVRFAARGGISIEEVPENDAKRKWPMNCGMSLERIVDGSRLRQRSPTQRLRHRQKKRGPRRGLAMQIRLALFRPQLIDLLLQGLPPLRIECQDKPGKTGHGQNQSYEIIHASTSSP